MRDAKGFDKRRSGVNTEHLLRKTGLNLGSPSHLASRLRGNDGKGAFPQARHAREGGHPGHACNKFSCGCKIKRHGITTMRLSGFLLRLLLLLALFATGCTKQDSAEQEKLNQEQLAMLLQFERKVIQVQQAVKSGILADDSAYLVTAAQTSLEVFDLLDQIKAAFPDAADLEKSYQDFYAKLLTIVTLFFENRLERGRATLMELEESHVFIYGKLRAIMSTATGDGCVPCFSQ